MLRTSLPLFSLLVLFIAVQAPAPPALRVAIVESKDQFTDVLGLSEYFASRNLRVEDWSDTFERGKVPSMEGIDLVVIGSFVSADREKQATYEKAAEALRGVVERGGVVAVLCQADQHSDGESWMPAPHRLTRADPDAPVAHALQAEHPLWVGGEILADVERRGWKVPTNWRNYNTIWEAFSDWNEAAIVVAGDDAVGTRVAGVVEMGWGKGRAVFYAMAADKAFVAGNAPAKSGGTKLLTNLVAYAELVKRGEAPDVVVTPAPGFNHPIQGTVYRDANGNGVRDDGEPGLEGLAVSDGFDVVFTDSEGNYKLENAGHDAPFVFLHQQDGMKYHGQEFFQRMPNGGDAEVRFDFGVKPERREEEETRPVRFVQLTDSHIRNPDDRQYMIQATNEIYTMEPSPDFIIATGDLVDWGVDEHYQNYVAGMQKPTVPYFNCFGNHEIHMGPLERYHQYIGPDYFSFEMKGVVYLSLNCVTKTKRQDTWIARTLDRVGKGRPVVVFQHYPPTVEQTEQFAKLGVKSVFSGHWHSEKEMEHAGVQNINSPTFVMGGIDASPAGFKVVELKSDGSATTTWRYGFQDKRLTIVSPQGSAVDGSYFPIVVNAYDTRREVESVEWHLGSKEKPAAGGTLKRESATAWAGKHGHSHAHGHDHAHDHDHPHTHAIAPGSYPVEVTARDTSGATWTKREQVELIDGPPVTPAPQQEWHMFMGNAGHAGDAGDVDLKLPLRLVWSVDTGGDPDFASPIYADGRVYLALKKRTKGRIHGVAAFDPVGGERLWLKETAMAVNHTPAYHEGVLCVAEMGGRIHGLDAKTGNEVWHHDLIDDRGRFCYCAPAVHDGAFYAGVMRRTARLRAADGHVEWEKVLGSDNDWISTYASPAVSGDTLVMGGNFSGGASLAAVDAGSGKEKWGHGSSGRMLSSPTIVGEYALYVTTRSQLYCCQVKDGKEKWSVSLGQDWSATTPAVRIKGEGEGIVVAGSGDGRMHGIDLASGKIVWTHTSEETVLKLSPYRRDGRPLVSSATIAGDKVYFGSADGHLYCLDLESGKELWKYVVGLPVMSTPLVTGNALYVAAYDGRLYCFTGVE